MSSNEMNEDNQLELNIKKILTLNKKQIDREKQAREAAELERLEAARLAAAKIEAARLEAEAELLAELAEKEEEKRRLAEKEAEALAQLASKVTNDVINKSEKSPSQSPNAKQIENIKVEEETCENKEISTSVDVEMQVSLKDFCCFFDVKAMVNGVNGNC
jgi:hypothetical protein